MSEQQIEATERARVFALRRAELAKQSKPVRIQGRRARLLHSLTADLVEPIRREIQRSYDAGVFKHSLWIR